MIITIDGLNKDDHREILDDMFRLRARVFNDRLGWDVVVKDGQERDEFDDLDPLYVIGLDDDGDVVSCARALQTTGPHMLADVFSEILDGQPPLRSPNLWESTRFCVDTEKLSGGRGPNSISNATCELMIGAIRVMQDAGITDIVTVIDPIMDRVLRRSNNAPYDYVGKTTQMGKTKALAALLDCTDERIAAVRSFSGIEHDVLAEPVAAEELRARRKVARHAALPGELSYLRAYCIEQIEMAESTSERRAAVELTRHLGENFDRADLAAICEMPSALVRLN